MDPQLSAFALGLLFGAAKIGAVGTIVFGIAWWRSRRRLEQLQATLPDPDRLEERLSNLEQASDYTSAKLSELVESQNALLRQLAPGAKPALPESPQPDRSDTPRTPH